jgi:MarR family transcriptional regulator, temperature-dependent positive regulator of motility
MKSRSAEHRSPLHLLHKASQLADEIFETATEGLDITPRQFMVLATIERQAGVSQTALGEITGTDRSTMADIVRRLDTKGYVRRRRQRKDARTYSVTLTPSGRTVLDQVRPIANEVDKSLLAHLSPHDAQQLLRLLTCLVQFAAGHVLGGARSTR